MAEGVGFEPTRAVQTLPVFETGALGRAMRPLPSAAAADAPPVEGIDEKKLYPRRGYICSGLLTPIKVKVFASTSWQAAISLRRALVNASSSDTTRQSS
jgi:hypothetical protein